MTNRITSSTLQAQLDKLNDILEAKDYGDSAKMDLDHAACYGGYCLVWYNSNREPGIIPMPRKATPRMSGKELTQYLNGALDFVS